MSEFRIEEHAVLRDMVEGLVDSLGDRLEAVVLYGSAARGDFHRGVSDFNLLVVTRDLSVETLRDLDAPIRRWEKRGQPVPRLLSPDIITRSADVFPMELIDIKAHGVVLHGTDPLAGVAIPTERLRLQCERQLREKMMRLREGYIELHRKPKKLKALMMKSYTTFVALFRGCLRVLGGDVPVHNRDVVDRFCAVAGIDPAPFVEIERMADGDPVSSTPEDLFPRYYEQLTRAIDAVDRHLAKEGETTS